MSGSFPFLLVLKHLIFLILTFLQEGKIFPGLLRNAACLLISKISSNFCTIYGTLMGGELRMTVKEIGDMVLTLVEKGGVVE